MSWIPEPLPVGWIVTKVGNITEVIRGASPRPKGDPKYFGGEIPWIMIADVSRSPGRYISETRDTVTQAGALKSRYLKAGTLILSNSGTVCVPKILAVDGCVHDGFVAFPNLPEGLDIFYLYDFFSFIRPQIIQKHKQGVTQVNLNTEIVRDIEIPLPPLNEQRRIVAKIDALRARSQQVKEALEAIPPLLDQFRQSVLAAAFRGDLTADWREKFGIDFSKEWKELTLEALLSEPLANGRSVPDANQGFPVLRLTCLKNGHIDLSERKIGAWTQAEAKNFLVRKCDFLVARGNGSLSLVGRGGLVDCTPDDVAYPDTLIRVRVKHEIFYSEFLSLVWDSNIIREQVQAAAHTTAGIHKINQKSIGGFVLPVPPLAEQQEIVHCVKSLLQTSERIKQQYQGAKLQLDQLDQSILAKAFRSKLVPQDPNDEPASVLLERIRAERAKQEALAILAKKSTGKTSGQRSRKAKQEDAELVQLELPVSE